MNVLIKLTRGDQDIWFNSAHIVRVSPGAHDKGSYVFTTEDRSYIVDQSPKQVYSRMRNEQADLMASSMIIARDHG